MYTRNRRKTTQFYQSSRKFLFGSRRTVKSNSEYGYTQSVKTEENEEKGWEGLLYWCMYIQTTFSLCRLDSSTKEFHFTFSFFFFSSILFIYSFFCPLNSVCWHWTLGKDPSQPVLIMYLLPLHPKALRTYCVLRRTWPSLQFAVCCAHCVFDATAADCQLPFYPGLLCDWI